MGCAKHQTSDDANRTVHDTEIHLGILSNTIQVRMAQGYTRMSGSEGLLQIGVQPWGKRSRGALACNREGRGVHGRGLVILVPRGSKSGMLAAGKVGRHGREMEHAICRKDSWASWVGGQRRWGWASWGWAP
jgi:hypothetical protein